MVRVEAQAPPVVVQGTTPLQGPRIQATRFFLTYPRCETSAQVAFDRMYERFPGLIEWCLVAQEAHKDGTPHLHVAVVFKDKLRVSSDGGAFWDFVGGQHGNYQVQRNPVHVVRYVIKDGNFVCTEGWDPSVFIEAKAKKKSAKSVLVGRKVLAGERDMALLAEEFPGFMMMNMDRVSSFGGFLDAEEERKRVLADIPAPPSVGDLSPEECEVYDWISLAKSGDFSRRSKHLRIEGPTNIGKSSFAFALSKYFRIYTVPLDEDWYCDWDDRSYDLILFDEYKTQKTLQWLNNFSDGLGVKLKRKGKNGIAHKVKTPVLIISNYSWEDSYHKVHASNPQILATTQRRFEVVKFSQGTDMFRLCTLLEE